MSKPEIPQEVLRIAQATQDAAEAECIAESYVYGFGTGNAKTVLDQHIARALMSAEQRGAEKEREACARVAEKVETTVPDEWLDVAPVRRRHAERISTAIRNRSNPHD